PGRGSWCPLGEVAGTVGVGQGEEPQSVAPSRRPNLAVYATHLAPNGLGTAWPRIEAFVFVQFDDLPFGVALCLEPRLVRPVVQPAFAVRVDHVVEPPARRARPLVLGDLLDQPGGQVG